MIWEIVPTSECGQECDGNCWGPIEYKAPVYCLPKGTNPNDTAHYVAFAVHQFTILIMVVFIGGLAVGAIGSFIARCLYHFCTKRCRSPLRPSSTSGTLGGRLASLRRRRANQFPPPVLPSVSFTTHDP